MSDSYFPFNSPPQWARRQYGRKSDIFSLGVMLTELLSSEELWKSGGRSKILKGANERDFVHNHSPAEVCYVWFSTLLYFLVIFLGIHLYPQSIFVDISWAPCMSKHVV